MGCPPVNPCLHDGICVEKPFGFKCNCKSLYTGNRCQDDLSKTSKPPTTTSDITKCFVDGKPLCLNDGICIDTINGIKCQCLPLFTGSFCEIGKKK